MALIKLSYSITFKTPYHLSTWSRPWCDIQCGRHTSYSDSRDCQFSGGKSSLRYSYGFVLISERMPLASRIQLLPLLSRKSNGRFDTCMHPFARIRNIRSEFSRRDRTDTSSEIRSAQIVGAGPLICSGSEHDIINWLIRTIIDRDLHQRHILCCLDIAFCIMHHPGRYLIRLREFSNLLIMIFRVVIRCNSNNDRSSGNNNCKKVGNVIKPWMLSTQESFQETPHILDCFLNLLPNTAYTHIPQNTRRIETSIKIRKHP